LTVVSLFRRPAMFEAVAKAVGSLVILKFAVDVGFFVFNAFFRKGIPPSSYGKWAIVTGATDGIGKAFAFELAKKKCNVLLISRTQSKLDEVAKEISDKYAGTEVKTLAIDFGQFTESARNQVAQTVKGLDVGVLVNNVGMSYEFPQYFHELTDQEVAQLQEINCSSTLWMSRIVLPIMKAKTGKNKGAIINISSGAGTCASPLLAEYSAAKGFIQRLSESMAAEYEKDGIFVQCQTPLFVTTKLSKIRKSSIVTPTPEAYAKVGVNALGGPFVFSPYFAHSIQLALLNAVPNVVANKLQLQMHLGLRARGMKKRDSQKKN